MTWNYSLTCDGCGGQTNEEVERSLVLKRAKEAGWALRGARTEHGRAKGHFCPDCLKPQPPQCPSCRRDMRVRKGDDGEVAICMSLRCRHRQQAFPVTLNTADNAYYFADDEDSPLTRKEERAQNERDLISARMAADEEEEE